MNAASRAPLVEPSRSPVPQFYRVVSEPEHVVPRSGTHMCRGCYGSRKKVERGVARACSWCEGYGRLLGADDKVWPIPVEAV